MSVTKFLGQQALNGIFIATETTFNIVSVIYKSVMYKRLNFKEIGRLLRFVCYFFVFPDKIYRLQNKTRILRRVLLCNICAQPKK